MLASAYTHAAATVLKYITTTRGTCHTLDIGYTPPPIHTEKANPFFTITNRAGGWVISKSFPWGYDRSKMVGNPLLPYLSYTFFQNVRYYTQIY